jgi:hypothetical protein
MDQFAADVVASCHVDGRRGGTASIADRVSERVNLFGHCGQGLEVVAVDLCTGDEAYK